MQLKLFEFLQGSSGENSSKRLAFLLGHISITFGFFWTGNKFIDTNHPELVLEIYNSYLFYCSILGGFVTADILVNLLEIYKGKNKTEEPKPIQEVKDDKANFNNS
jgi:hypothetical protein